MFSERLARLEISMCTNASIGTQLLAAEYKQLTLRCSAVYPSHVSSRICLWIVFTALCSAYTMYELSHSPFVPSTSFFFFFLDFGITSTITKQQEPKQLHACCKTHLGLNIINDIHDVIGRRLNGGKPCRLKL